MSEEFENNPIEELTSSAKEYINLKIDEAKLSLAENLAGAVNRMIVFFLTVVVGALAFGFLAAALSSWLGTIFDSVPLGHLTTCALFIIILIILFIFRKRFFIDSMVRLFIKILYDTKKPKDGK